MKYIARYGAILLFAAVCFAKPNFSGKWKMDNAKSDFGPIPGPQKMLRTVQHDEPKIKIVNEQAGAQGEIRTELNYTTDGKEFTNTSRGGESKGTASWVGDSLVVKTKRTLQGSEIDQTDRWTMSPDGKTMDISTTLKTPQGEFEIKIAFEKQ
jgi:hypothetical protein